MASPETQQPASATDGAGGKRPRIPPRWVWAVLLVLGLLIAAGRSLDIFRDHTHANILTWILAFLAVLTLAVWFLLLSGYSGRTRTLTLVAGLAAVPTLLALFRVDHMSGELIPTFVFRYVPKRDRLIQQPALPAPEGRSTASVDLRTTTEHDFPQFLGPDRSVSVPRIKLVRDWKARPPELVWRQPIGAGWSAFSVVNGHAVTMEQRGDREMVTCYSVAGGQLEWAYSHSARFETVTAGVGPRSTPTIHEGMVYVLGAKGDLVCLDGATGEPRWQKDLLQEFGLTPEAESAGLPHGRAASPLVVGDLVIVPAGGPPGRRVSLVAYQRQTGNQVWQGGTRQISYSSPAVATLAGTEQILIVNEDCASGHDAKTGRVLWEHPWEGHSSARPNASQAVAVPPDRVLLSKGYGRGAALVQLVPQGDGSFRTNTLWDSRRVMRTKFTNVAVKDGWVYGLSDGILECIELDTGQRIWKEGRYHHGQILLASELLLVLSESGEMVLVEATPERPNHVLGRFQALEGMTWNTIALAGPYLLVRNAQEAACYRLPLSLRSKN